MKLIYIGHSALYFDGETKILVDPFISDNPWVKNDNYDFYPDYIFLSHGHGDHLGDTFDIAKRSGATVVAPFELAQYCIQHGIKAHPMHIGGKFNFDFGWIKLTNALHGSGLITDNEIIYLGNPCGFLWETENKRFYYAGDTGLTMDMKLLKDYKIDYAFLPIGGNFTMDVDDALKAAEFISPKTVIPIHFNTFDVIKSSPEEFVEKIKHRGMNSIYLKPGTEIEI
ncbi:MAG: metal-dependent hydrolase [Candidatus Mcinerneyibacterium aminivorans]|jgi:L-ascorbate metabolism protein UlaG (beta-lactamase superfamily)|uniref:UPF0173 metal-dependent hydrolase FXF47_02705 n=1 Tax=Candidatus Mcinerneyibacterium aminivorans TaxID=2703815 RepID=A0A5D0MK22_9BACT|nr:MAG: metal-dependent hydrolase [Candidatus Mcinerneyibacterium aminivorans]